jgi:hypothetical protein
MGLPQMFWDDDVQGPPDRFRWQITKEFGRGAVPDLNHSLSIREDDPIRGLLDHESEQLKAIRAGQHRASLRNRSDKTRKRTAPIQGTGNKSNPRSCPTLFLGGAGGQQFR